MKMVMKKTGKKGFTLAELLIVVAIIGVLVGISIPIFTAQLTKSKIATNQANMRAAKAAAVSDYLGEAKTGSVDYVYDVDAGTIDATTGSTVVSDGVATKIALNITDASGEAVVDIDDTGMTLS